MSVVSITIEESSEQIVAGIPRTVSLSPNLPSTIFYTLDGSVPDDSSYIYISPIKMPTDLSLVNLKFYATNGYDNSALISKEYSTSIIKNTRFPHARIGGITNSTSGYPFGSSTQFDNIQYLPPNINPDIVNNPSLPVIPFGFDAAGQPAGGTNLPLMDYHLIPPQTDNVNRQLPGVIPNNTIVVGRRYPIENAPEETSRASKLFNPKAMVIFQNTETEDPALPPMINRSDFSTENLEVVNYGAKLRAVSSEVPSTTGSFIKAYYNPRTGLMTNYYRDSSTNKWIISSYPYTPKDIQPNIASYVTPAGPRIVGKIFQTHLWIRRTLT